MIAAAELAQALGGEIVMVRGEEQILAPGPGHSPGDRSLSVRFGPRGLVVHSFADDDLKATRVHLRKICGRGTRTTKWTAPRARPLATPKPDVNALWVWKESEDPRPNSRVIRYLENHRGVALPDCAANTAVRSHVRCRFRWEVVHAMVCLVRNIATDQPQAIHRTALSWHDRNYSVGGDKRLALGPTSGGAIKFTPHEMVGEELGVAEGVETALSLLLLDHGPGAVWSLLNAGNLAGFPVLAGVRRLVIAVDYDPAGERAAEACAARWTKAGKEVVLHRATTPGEDLNDVIRKGSA
jgi:hypothetical protein